MPRRALLALSSSFALAWSCSYDWDSYDPRHELELIGETGGAGASSGVAAGGSGGTGGSGGAAIVCGDGTVDPGEQCDDGGTLAGDGCDAGCQVECDTLLDPQTGHCYALLELFDDIWDAARTECALLGDGFDLAAMSSQAEIDWLSAQATIDAYLVDDVNAACFWIGGSDVDVEATWVWSNGEPFFDRWVAGEPNDDADGAGGGMVGEDCTVMSRRDTLVGYDDRRCDGIYPALCERAPAGRAP
jgi:cysteine-rich repeat protein